MSLADRPCDEVVSLRKYKCLICVALMSHMCLWQTSPVIVMRLFHYVYVNVSYVSHMCRLNLVSYVSLADLPCRCDEGDSLQSSNALSSLYDRVTLDTNSFFYASKYKYRRTKKLHSNVVMSFLFDRLTLEKQMISLMLNAMLKYKKYYIKIQSSIHSDFMIVWPWTNKLFLSFLPARTTQQFFDNSFVNKKYKLTGTFERKFFFFSVLGQYLRLLGTKTNVFYSLWKRPFSRFMIGRQNYHRKIVLCQSNWYLNINVSIYLFII